MWRFYDLVAPSRKFRTDLANMDFPFSVKPDKKVSVQDVMAFTRDKSYGTAFDPVNGIRGGPYQNPNYYAKPGRSASPTPNTRPSPSAGRAPDSSAASSGWPGAPRTRPVTCRSTPA